MNSSSPDFSSWLARLVAFKDAKDFQSAIFIGEGLIAQMKNKDGPKSDSSSSIVSSVLSCSSHPASPLFPSLVVELGDCFYQEYGASRAFHFLKSHCSAIHPSSSSSVCSSSPVDRQRHRLFLARCAFELEKFQDCENALTQTQFDLSAPLTINYSAAFLNSVIPCGASGFYLFGRLCQRLSRTKEASANFRKAIELDSHCWGAVKALADMGEQVDTDRLFQLDDAELNGGAHQSGPARVDSLRMDSTPAARHTLFPPEDHNASATFVTPVAANSSIFTPPNRAGAPVKVGHQNSQNPPASGNLSGRRHQRSQSLMNFNSGALNSQPSNMRTPAIAGPTPANRKISRLTFSDVKGEETPDTDRSGRKTRRALQGVQNSLEKPSKTPKTAANTSAASSSTRPPAAPARRPTRAVGGSGMKRIDEREDGQEEGEGGLEKQFEDDDSENVPPAQNVPANNGSSSFHLLLQKSFQTLAAAYIECSLFRCKSSLALLNSLPAAHRHSPLVLSLIGRAHFESSQYSQARAIYSQQFQYFPYFFTGLEYYSSTLWQLKNSIELSYLCQRMYEIDHLSWESHLSLGNLFSLQKDHEAAIKYFHRSLQLDRENSYYSATLAGHEYVANEDFEKGVSCYRMALAENGRHYNAWYGIGNVCFRQEKYQLAAFHFQEALNIHSGSAILHCYLAMVKAAQLHVEEALSLLSRAHTLEPGNPLVMFQQASLLTQISRDKDAQVVLEKLKEIVPRESAVRAMLGKLYKRAGRTDEAICEFLCALDLDQKDRHGVKNALEKIGQIDEMQENEEEEMN